MQVEHIPISAIEILPDRQREDYGDIAGLAASIREHGQLQPIVVTKISDGQWRLVAGGRRLRAITSLQHTHVHAVLREELPRATQELLELEENVRRKDLDWPEYVLAVARYVEMANKSQREVAEDLQIHESSISKIATLAPALVANPKLRSASSWKSAYDLHTTQIQKEQASLVEDVMASVANIVMPAGFDAPVINIPIAPPEPPKQIFALQQDFQSWAAEYSDKRFNLIHCDFPYGLNMDTANLQGSSDRWDLTDGRYSDAPELFDELTTCFFKHQDRFIAESAHCIFWLAHKNFGRIWSKFRYFGWTPCEVPLIWHKSDGAGIAPDVRRQPRRTYEIAIFASRGDRFISKVKAASIAAPTTKEHHLSEKPLAVVTHFLEMVIDGTSEILDPTCGSGTALEAGLRLGAKRVLGLDVLAQHVEHTNKRCAGASAPADALAGLISDL